MVDDHFNVQEWMADDHLNVQVWMAEVISLKYYVSQVRLFYKWDLDL